MHTALRCAGECLFDGTIIHLFCVCQYPVLFKAGGGRQAFLLRGRQLVPCLDQRIAIAVSALEDSTAARGDRINPVDTEKPTFSDRHTPLVCPLGLIGWEHYR